MPAILQLKLDQLLFPKLVKDIYRFEALSKSQSDWRIKQQNLKARDFFAALLEATDPKTGRGFSHDELISEAGLLIIAGSDTMATGITSTIFYLLHYPLTLLRLQNEVRGAFDNIEEVRAGSRLNSCRYLVACLDEAMRLTPGVGSLLPRETLAGGIIIDGEYFPKGIDLGVPHYCIQHNEEYYPEPFKFKPERWLVEASTTPTDIAIAQSAFCPFSLGRASCIGKTIAYQEMSIILARAIWLYDMRLQPGPGSSVGEGRPDLGYGRMLKDEFQVHDNFTSTHRGPLVEFKPVHR
jgi:cytochrome P450